MTELLAPAGSYEIAYKALTNGADAVYLATERFGARAYAKNLTLDELQKIVNVAKILNKKVYVTVNTLIKDSELDELYNYLDTLYKIGVDAIIATDYAVVNYIINNLPNLECHISTQVGVKNLEDIKYFESLGAKRAVLAREVDLKEIENIKRNSKLPIEVFVHGALCVSYSGNCYMSSLITLRSGNRGRCSQNCRFPYQLIEDDKTISKTLNLLSMKDLNTFDSIPKLKDLNVDSLKIEGRMKDENYVINLVREYRKKLDDKNYKTAKLNKIFHREYTKGFLNGEDNGNVVYSLRSGNIGDYIGLIKYNNKNYKVDIIKELKEKDRIRITTKDKDYYFTVTDLFDLNQHKTTSIKKCGYVSLPEIIEGTNKLYIMEYSEKLIEDEIIKKPLDLIVNGNILSKLSVLIYYDNETYLVESDNVLSESISKPLTSEVFYKQFNKFSDYPLYIRDLSFNITDNVFITISEINALRRKALEKIFNHEVSIVRKKLTLSKKDLKKEIIAKCHTIDQYNACKEMGIETIFYGDNHISYTSSNYSRKDDNLLVSNYGAILNNKDKNLTLDSEFNVLNSDSLAYFLKSGVNNVTLSKELSFSEIKDLVSIFRQKYGFIPAVDLIIYGHQELMTTKYCIIKHQGKCPGCQKHQYYLKDSTSKFPIIHDKCISIILNEKSTNLIDEIPNLKPYINRFRLDFTIEDYGETKKIIKNAIDSFNDIKTNSFNQSTDTRAYFKRKIL